MRSWSTMTERKPPGTSWETWIDAQIRVAREQGAFDNLPGAGKPLPNLDDPDWWVKQLVQREQISILPPSLELLRKVEKELAAIEKLHDEVTVRRRVAALNVEIAKVNATVMEGPPTRLSTLDVDKVVERWRRTRPANPRELSDLTASPERGSTKF
jgi:DnaJ homologue, subfamily C, member 28, conserved domain